MAIDFVINMRHAVQTLIGIGQQSLGSLETVAGLQQPAMGYRIQTHHQHGVIGILHLGGGGKTAAIDQIHGPNIAAVFGGIGLSQCQEGVLFMAGCAALALHTVGGLAQSGAHHLTLTGMGAAQMDHLQIAAGDGGTGGSHMGQLQGAVAMVGQLHTAGKTVTQYGIREDRLQAGQLVQ